MVMETGDATYESRKERYEYIVKRRGEKPRPTLQMIANELGVSRQNVHRTLKRAEVRPSGRPRSNAGRRRFQLGRLGKWQKRRMVKLAANKPTDIEDAWIAKIEAKIKDLS